VDRLTLSLVAGRVTVTFGGYAVDGAVTAGLRRNLDRIPISRVLGLSEDGLNVRRPMQEVFTGFIAIVVPLNDLGILKRCRVDREQYFELVESTEAKNIFVF
jgi:predicted PhzF superfamily epimerase YddE/YHI9